MSHVIRIGRVGSARPSTYLSPFQATVANVTDTRC